MIDMTDYAPENHDLVTDAVKQGFIELVADKRGDVTRAEAEIVFAQWMQQERHNSAPRAGA